MLRRVAISPIPGLVAAVSLLAAAAARAEHPAPVLEGPIPGTPFIASTAFDLSRVGYVQEEFFLSGTARSFANLGALTPDGEWSVAPADEAEYVTRILVNRPAERRKFNGTVIVEWLNVSGGLDASPDWTMTHTELIRRGYAWVGVSAQIVGIEGGGILGVLPDLGLKQVNPERYGSLVHPGDSFSYDIFAQAGRALRRPSGARPLGDLRPARVIAMGESQSAFRLTTYTNAVHPLVRVYDGFLVHSRGASSAPLSEAPQAAIPAPSSVLIRTDLDVPVLTFETETDLTFLNYFFDRQPDTEHFRLWEAAGTAHADTYTTVLGPTDLGDDPSVAELVITKSPVPGLAECEKPINSGPQHFVLKAAVRALDRWVRTGKAPPPAPRLEATADPRVTIVRDELGNALGGIRTPQVDVPIATLSGGGQTGSVFCLLFGSTMPFDEETLAELYPTHRDFVRAFRRATLRAVRAGWVLPPDGSLMRRAARKSDIGE